MQRCLAITLLLFSAASLLLCGPFSFGQQDESGVPRKLVNRVAPVYPDLARRTNLSGAVKLVLVVAPDGTVKSAEVIGGNPVLVKASVDAVRRWRYESGPEQTREVIQLKFDTH